MNIGKVVNTHTYWLPYTNEIMSIFSWYYLILQNVVSYMDIISVIIECYQPTGSNCIIANFSQRICYLQSIQSIEMSNCISHHHYCIIRERGKKVWVNPVSGIKTNVKSRFRITCEGWTQDPVQYLRTYLVMVCNKQILHLLTGQNESSEVLI